MRNLKSRQIIDGAIIIFLVVGAWYVLFSPYRSNIKKESIVVEQKTTEREYVENSFITNENISVKESISVANIETLTDKMEVNGYSSSMGNRRDIYELMHRMINTKIIAEDGQIWGEVEVTREYCEDLIKIIKSSDYEDKETLIRFLNNWKNGSFKKGVIEHNYLWGKLNGNIGKALKLRDGVK